MIKAVYREGKIQPVDPVPSDWVDGQSLEYNCIAWAVGDSSKW